MAHLSVLRGSDMLDLEVALEGPPEIPPRDQTELEAGSPLAGAVVANLSPAVIEETGYGGSLRQGVVVLEVRRGSPAARLRLAPGDVVLSLNGTRITDVAMLEEILAAGSRGGWRIAVRRGEETLETVVYG
jgi:serine protease Do